MMVEVDFYYFYFVSFYSTSIGQAAQNLAEAELTDAAMTNCSEATILFCKIHVLLFAVWKVSNRALLRNDASTQDFYWIWNILYLRRSPWLVDTLLDIGYKRREWGREASGQ